jgi:meso-butanediol dehydrogenase / (S,S)-butanediol dehydrogenase / diacetyl reductase
MTLAKKVYLVAGVGPGLGTALVSRLASEGASVTAVARSSKALEPLTRHARSRGWAVSGRTADLLEQGDVDRTVRDALSEFGTLDGLSINLGHWLGGETLLHRMSDAEWAGGIRENLDSVFRIARATLPHLIERGSGSVVLVSAAPAIRWAGSASYDAAKGGLADLVTKLARDYRPTGVRVNAVLPGSMSHELASLDPPPMDRPVPLTNERRETSPWEVASAIRFLLSDESRWVTGTLLVVDGGLSTGGLEPGRHPPA